MSQISPILRETDQNGLVFWCPGCDAPHRIPHGAGSGPRWAWNGDVNRPTFSPSVLVTTGHYCERAMPAGADKSCWCTYYAEHPDEPQTFKCVRCHSFVRDGQIQFLGDCSHALAGQTVALPAWSDA